MLDGERCIRQQGIRPFTGKFFPGKLGRSPDVHFVDQAQFDVSLRDDRALRPGQVPCPNLQRDLTVRLGRQKDQLSCLVFVAAHLEPCSALRRVEGDVRECVGPFDLVQRRGSDDKIIARRSQLSHQDGFPSGGQSIDFLRRDLTGQFGLAIREKRGGFGIRDVRCLDPETQTIEPCCITSKPGEPDVVHEDNLFGR